MYIYIYICIYILDCLLQRARGQRGAFQPPSYQPRPLAALLAWALAPHGFIAVGQTPALYGAKSFNAFATSVRAKGGSVPNTLCWSKASEQLAKDVAYASGCQGVSWSATHEGEVLLGVEPGGAPHGQQMSQDCEFLCRLCGPFNGKETTLSLGMKRIPARPPRHPCAMNWYMPRMDGCGVLEVRVGWKSQAETLLQVPRPGDCGRAKCRPKRLLVASGGQYVTSGQRRNLQLRGVTVLPSDDGGRSALLWLLAAGAPREASFVAMVAPHDQSGFVMRAMRFWQCTLWLPPTDPITDLDLRAVNAFRQALVELQRRRPHPAAGLWHAGGQVHSVEQVDEVAEGGASGLEVLLASEGPGGRPLTLKGRVGEGRWRCYDGELQTLLEVHLGVDGCLAWSDGVRWVRPGGSGVDDAVPLLEALGPGVVAGFAEAARHLLAITEASDAAPAAGPQWLARLVPLRPRPEAAGDPFAPFDLEAVEATMEDFRDRLREDDVEDDEDLDTLGASDEEGSDSEVDVSHEIVDEEFMWRLAELPSDSFGPREARSMVFAESALAMPQTAICSECELEGRVFSKSQLSKHPDDRRCQGCVQKSLGADIIIISSSSSSTTTTTIIIIITIIIIMIITTIITILSIIQFVLSLLLGVVYRPAAHHAAGAAVAAAANVPAPSVLRAGALPVYAAGHGVAVAACSVCGQQLTKETCSSTQRAKVPSRRRCLKCVKAPG